MIISDIIAPTGEKTVLIAETKGKFFSKGGEIVEFFINGKSIGNTLSGGDGRAFKKFTPVRSGIHHINAKSGADEGHGLLLSLKKEAEIIFVDIQGSLLQGPFSMEPRGGSQKATKEINVRFPIVFLRNGLLSLKTARAWLKGNKFIELPVVSWNEGKVFNEIYEMGFKIKALIGNPQIIESAKKYHPTAFSFEEAEDAIEVKGWEEIKERLK